MARLLDETHETSSDEGDKQQLPKSAISTVAQRGRQRLMLTLEHFRDRLRHANPFATPAARCTTLALILCCCQVLTCKRITTRFENLYDMCHRLRQEYELEHISQFRCMRMSFWLNWQFSSPLFHLCIIGFILAPIFPWIFLRVFTGRLWNHGVTTVKIAESYLTVLNLVWLLDDAWALWTNSQDQLCSD